MAVSINSIFDILMNKYNESVGKRFGLRYINQINNENEDCINEDYYNLIFNKASSSKRLVVNYEYDNEDEGISLLVKYGYLNKEYPSRILNKDFTIDIDAYVNGIIYLNNISTLLNSMHFEIQNCFENMISDKYRSDLNNNGQ